MRGARTVAQRCLGATIAAVFAVPILAGDAHAASASPEVSRTTREVAPGITFTRMRFPDGPVRVFVLRIDLDQDVRLDVALGDRSLPVVGTAVPRIAATHDAIAAVNGDLGVGVPDHAFAEDGIVLGTPRRRGFAAAFTVDHELKIGRPDVRFVASTAGGDRFRIARWNGGPPMQGELAGFTRLGGIEEAPPPRACSVRLVATGARFWSSGRGWVQQPFRVDDVACGPEPMPLLGGVVVSGRTRGRGAGRLRSLTAGSSVRLSWSTGWRGAVDVQGGFPLLVRNGHVAADGHCVQPDFCDIQPRTGVGATRGCDDADATTGCTALYVVVDGRRSGWSQGMRLVDFARLFRSLGAWSALNLDGGGASTMVVEGRVVNRPSEGLRPVTSAFLVAAGDDPGERPLAVAGAPVTTSFFERYRHP
jgi:hypothetical protein